MRIVFTQDPLYQYSKLLINYLTLFRGVYKLYEAFPIYNQDLTSLLQKYTNYKDYFLSKAIIFPNLQNKKALLDYLNKFKQEFYNLNNTIRTISKYLRLHSTVLNELQQLVPLPIQNIQLSEKKKASISAYILNSYLILKDIFPQSNTLKKVIVSYTYYGSNISFSLSDSNLEILIRHNIPLYTLGKEIAKAILYSLLQKADLTPLQRSALEYVILNHSRVIYILDRQHYKKDKIINSKIIEDIYNFSSKVLKDLNIYKNPQDLYIDTELFLWVYGAPTKIKLSPTEGKLLSYLLQNRDQIINYYRIGDLLWPTDPNKFSMWAISQLIHKIRYKLHKAGFPDQKLQNIKGHGYVLRR